MLSKHNRNTEAASSMPDICFVNETLHLKKDSRQYNMHSKLYNRIARQHKTCRTWFIIYHRSSNALVQVVVQLYMCINYLISHQPKDATDGHH